MTVKLKHQEDKYAPRLRGRDVYDPTPYTSDGFGSNQKDEFGEHSTAIYATIGSILFVVLLLCLYTLHRGPHRRWWTCYRPGGKKGDDEAVPHVKTVGLWGKSDAPTMQRAGVYLTDLKQAFGTPNPGSNALPTHVGPLSPVSPATIDIGVQPATAQTSGGRSASGDGAGVAGTNQRAGPRIIDGGMGTGVGMGSSASPMLDMSFKMTNKPNTLTKTSPLRSSPLSVSPSSPSPRTPASRLAKEWKRQSRSKEAIEEEVRKRTERSMTNRSSGSSFGQPYPLDLDAANHPLPSARATESAIIQPNTGASAQTHPGQAVHEPRPGSIDQNLSPLPPPARPARRSRPRTNFTYDTTTDSTPSIYSSGTPNQSLYVPGPRGSSIRDSRESHLRGQSYTKESGVEGRPSSLKSQMGTRAFSTFEAAGIPPPAQKRRSRSISDAIPLDRDPPGERAQGRERPHISIPPSSSQGQGGDPAQPQGQPQVRKSHSFGSLRSGSGRKSSPLSISYTPEEEMGPSPVLRIRNGPEVEVRSAQVDRDWRASVVSTHAM